MSDIHELLGQIPVQQIASLLGTDTASAQAAVEAAVPTLLAGLQNNVQAPDGAAALESELASHLNGLADGGVDPSQVDTQDGEKIVAHVFGGQQDQVASRLAGTANLGGVGGDLVRKLLPILAPIVMSYLAKKVLGGGRDSGAQDSGAQGSPPSRGSGGIDLGSILGGILGGGLGGLGTGGLGSGGRSDGGQGDGGPGSGGLGSGALGDILGGILRGGPQPPQAQLNGQDQGPPAQSANEPSASDAGQTNDAPAPNDSAPPAHRSVTPGELIEVDLPDESR
ncbi:DUF937 domain-containing protein [Arthrobacter sp. NPDC057013]|uniref:DUF937 domain-containing protein n=1 Tax=Arthrobacter sp. NPDC057013 TaxID=3345999 RepID=UPI00362D6430